MTIYNRRAIKYCICCGGRLATETIEGKDRGKCPGCGYIAYENPLPVVSAVVVNNRKEILLIKRAREPKKGMWALPSGFVETDETIEEAALRELKEEAGIEGKIKRLIHAQTENSSFYGNIIMISFEVENAGGVLKAGDDAVDAKFFPLDGLPEIAFKTNECAIRKFLS